MRRFLTLVTSAAAAVVLAAPMAHASTTKFEFHDVELSAEVQDATIYATVKTMKKKPDNVYCGYATNDWQPLGYYLEFVEPAPTEADNVRAFCVMNFDDRWQ